MRTERTICIVLISVLFPALAIADVAIPGTVPIGAYVQKGGSGFSYQGSIRIDLYATPPDASVWSQTFDNASIVDGWLALMMDHGDDGAPLSEVIRTNTGVLEFAITIGNDDELPARLPLSSAPYAIMAMDTLTLQGTPADGFATADHVHSFNDLTDIPDAFPPSSHTHGWGELTGIPQTFPPSEHDHDDRYATKDELQGAVSGNNLLAGLREALDLGEQTDDETRAALHNLITRDCPLSYEKVVVGIAEIPRTGYTCRRMMSPGPDAIAGTADDVWDEMVKVGRAFVDRYESSLNDQSDCSGAEYGVANYDAHLAGFQRNASDITKPMYACSCGGHLPARWLTWFQASMACALSGKELISNTVWQLAVAGTDDRTGEDANGYCNINNLFGGPVATGSRPNCRSMFGALDMVGNVSEWTTQWMDTGGDDSESVAQEVPEYKGDFVGNVTRRADGDTFLPNPQTYYGKHPRFPAVAIRGGNWKPELTEDGTTAGPFHYGISDGPSYWSQGIGFRCMIR